MRKEPNKSLLLSSVKKTIRSAIVIMKGNARLRNNEIITLTTIVALIPILSWISLYLTNSIAKPVANKDPLTRHYHFFMPKFPPIHFYIYQEPAELNNRTIFTLYGSNPPPSTSDTYVDEAIIHKSLLNSQFHSHNPNESDLFYVPLYLGSYGRAKIPVSFQYLMNDIIKQGPYYARNGGLDHIITQILLPLDWTPITTWEMPSIASMVTSGDLIKYFSPRESTRFTITPIESNCDIINGSRHRSVAVFFQGATLLYEPNATKMRKKVVPVLETIPESKVIVSERYESNIETLDFGVLMRDSEICVVPVGDVPMAKRFFDALRSLCVPLIISDDARYTFEDVFIDYTRFVNQIPMEEAGGVISRALSLMNSKMIKEKRDSINKINRLLRNRVDYQIESGELMWGWLWMQYFQACNVKSSIRRGLLRSKVIP